MELHELDTTDQFLGTMRQQRPLENADLSRMLASRSMIRTLNWAMSGGSSQTYGKVALDHSVGLADMAIETDASSLEGYLSLALSMVYQQNAENALKAIDLAKSRCGASDDMFLIRADALCVVGAFDEAFELLQTVPAGPYATWVLASLYFGKGEYQKVVALKDKLPSCGWRILSAALALVGEKEEAKYFGAQYRKMAPRFNLDIWTHHVPNLKGAAPMYEGLRLAGYPC